MLPVAILAGGLAVRLRPITEKVPKALIDIAGKPFILRQLNYLRKQGVMHVVLCVGYLGESIEKTVGDGSTIGIDVKYSWDGPRLLGTGGALKQALPLLGEEFFVLYGDSFLPIDFLSVEKAYYNSGQPALMTVLRNADLWDKSNVMFRDGKNLFYDKKNPKKEMDYIDYGLGVLSKKAFTGTQDNEPFDLADIYNKLSLQNALAGQEVYERFYEIGSQNGLKETIEYFQKGEL